MESAFCCSALYSLLGPPLASPKKKVASLPGVETCAMTKLNLISFKLTDLFLSSGR